MLKIQIENKLTSSADEAWQVLRTFKLSYFKGFPYTINGSGVGAERSFAMPDGEMTERISAFDEQNMTLSYVIVEGPWPVKNYTATIKVKAEEEGCLVSWSAVFEPDQADPETTAERVAGTFKMNLRALDKFLNA